MAKIKQFWSHFWSGHKAKKRYVAFFTVVPLLFLLAVIKVPCPICDGTGIISTTGMGGVVVIHVDSTLKSVGVVEGCVNFISFNYNVALTLQNKDEQLDANGYVQLGLVDYKTSKMLASQYVLVGVPANMELTTIFSTTFSVGIDAPITTQVTAGIILSGAPCQECNGTGKVALNQLPLLSAMKETYVKAQQVSVYPIAVPAPIQAVSDEWYGAEGYITADEWIALHPGTVEQQGNIDQ